MRRSILLLLCLAVAAPAASQTPRKRVRGQRILPADALAPAAPAGPVAPTGPAPRLTLTGLPPVGDARATCRATCARQRFQCEAGGEDCSPAWSRCTAACQTAPRQ